MPSKSKTTRKPRLDRKTLEEAGVEFCTDVCEDRDLEGWIISIRNRVTCLGTKLPRKSKKTFQAEFEKYKETGHDREESIGKGWSLRPQKETESVYYVAERFQKDRNRKKNMAELRLCGKLSQDAVNFRERNELENTWTHFLRNEICPAFDSVYQDPDPTM